MEQLAAIVIKMDKKMDLVLTRLSRSNEDLTPYFPVSNQEQLLQFMSNADKKFDQRKLALEELLTDAVRMEPDPNSFSDVLFSVLFKKSYSFNHRWPNPQ